jgi:cytochrome c oxidase cbb3-type subunit 2
MEESMKIAAVLLIGLLLTLTAAGAAETASARRTLQLGRQIYRDNCAVCHGVQGDGNGPAASMFRIQPRDFRTGTYKFRSTPADSLPTDDDLLRTVTQGVRGTAMIGRPDLGDNERRAVTQHMKTFSPRFEKEKPGRSIAVHAAPGTTPQVLQQVKRLYIEAGCRSCHGTEGRGGGPSSTGLKDDWGRPIWPPNLTWRPLKRGSDTRETYLTLVTGLYGTPMPSYADALNGQEIWALVTYLESLVPPEHRLDPNQLIGEEQQGWMTLRMGGMMGGGMMHRSR